MREALTVNDLYNELGKAIKMGYGSKHLLIASDDEGNEFHPMFFALSPTEGNVDSSTLYGVGYEDAIENYMIVG